MRTSAGVTDVFTEEIDLDYTKAGEECTYRRIDYRFDVNELAASLRVFRVLWAWDDQTDRPVFHSQQMAAYYVVGQWTDVRGD